MIFYNIFEAIGAWAYALGGLISLAIGFIALRGYIYSRSWRFLFLSLAFLILAIFPLMVLIDFFFSKASFNMSSTNVPSFIVAITLLAVVYIDETRKEEIKITKTQWLVAGALILPELALCVVILSQGLSFLDSLYVIIYYGLAYILAILTILSLFAYNKTKGSRSTFLTMVGFICLLIGQTIGITLFIHLIPFLLFHSYNDISYAIVGLIDLLGYLAFLAAMTRARSSND